MNFLNRRVSCLGIIVVNMANPNGDPDYDGRPRIIASSGHGMISDVSIKRKIRNLFSPDICPASRQFYIDLYKLDSEKYHILESVSRGFEWCNQTEGQRRFLTEAKNDPNYITNRYFDVRLFGSTFLEKKEELPEEDDEEEMKPRKKKEKTSKNLIFKRSGPITISPAISIEPINIIEATNTRLADVDELKHSRNVTGMAPGATKAVVFGVYTFRLEFCPNHAVFSKTTEEDLFVLKGCLKSIWNQSPSRSRDSESIRFKHIWWATHQNCIGSFNPYVFYNKLTPHLVPGVTESDKESGYVFPVPEDCPELNGIEIENLAL